MTKTKIRFAWFPQIIDGKPIIFKRYIATYEEEKISKWVGNFVGEWVDVKIWKLKKKKLIQKARWPKY